MAIRNMLALGLGFSVGSVRFIVTQGLSFPTVLSGPGSVRGSQSRLGVPAGKNSDLTVLSSTRESELRTSRGTNSDLK